MRDSNLRKEREKKKGIRCETVSSTRNAAKASTAAVKQHDRRVHLPGMGNRNHKENGTRTKSLHKTLTIKNGLLRELPRSWDFANCPRQPSTSVPTSARPPFPTSESQKAGARTSSVRSSMKAKLVPSGPMAIRMMGLAVLVVSFR